jgi:hypothetical protein
MVELIAKISKGSRMDQVYIPKNRAGFSTGSYVTLRPVTAEKKKEKPYFYHVDVLEPIKVRVIEDIFSIVHSMVEEYDNVIITGSFLDKGFHFNDVDILILTSEKHGSSVEGRIEKEIGIHAQVIMLHQEALLDGLATDPLYGMMLSRCVAKKRFVYHAERRIDYKTLDLHLLKSKTLIDGFDVLDGDEKYYLVRNMVSIMLFVQGKKVSKELVDKRIVKVFHLQSVDDIKKNSIEKSRFLKKYKHVYQKTFDAVMEKAHGAEQK